MPEIGERFNPYKLFIGSFIPNVILRDKELSSTAKICYSRLCQYAGARGLCFPSQKTLAEEVGITRVQATRTLTELEQKGFIKRLRPDGKERLKHKTNQYVFLWKKQFEGDPSMYQVDTWEGKDKSEEDQGSKRSPSMYQVDTFGGIAHDTSGGINSSPPINILRESVLRESEEEKAGPLFPPPIFFQCDFFTIDQPYYEELKKEYPLIDFEKLFKKLKDTIFDEPKKYTRDGRGRLKLLRRIVRNWCEREIIWRDKNGKHPEGSDPIDRRARLIFGEGKDGKDRTVEKDPGAT